MSQRKIGHNYLKYVIFYPFITAFSDINCTYEKNKTIFGIYRF